MSSMEKRFFYRLATELAVELRVHGERDRGAIAGRSDNVSGGGMLVTCDPLDRGLAADLLEGRERLAVRFDLKDGGEIVECAARVIWAEGLHRVGVSFEDLPVDDQRRVDAFVIAHHAGA